MKFAIVAVGYNRVHSMKRLLESLTKADYQNDNVTLIISIDNSGNDEVENYAKDFEWNYGDKIVKTYPKRLGLRNHIITCGDYVYDYDAIAVFEDDIYVAPTFYKYMRQSVEYYKDDDNIAGISLYSHLWSEGNQRPFCPQKGKYDNYFLQYAQSWGEVFMPKQWKEFKEWYKNNSGEIVRDDKTPTHIANWPETSWLKYHMKYCIDNNKYLVYPYISFSTNFVEIGQHCKSTNTIYQVPMEYESNKKYDFCKFGSKDGIYYDAFFERIISPEELKLKDGNLEIDLYGRKNIGKSRYVVTTKKLDYKIIHKYGLKLRPQEMNILYNIQGEGIYLYDTTIKEKNKSKIDFSLLKWNYDSRVFDYRLILKIINKIIIRKLLGN